MARLKIIVLSTGIVLTAVSLWIQGQNWEVQWQWAVWILLLAGLAFFIAGQRIKAEEELPPRWEKFLGLFSIRWDGSVGRLICWVISPMLAVIACMAAGTEAVMKNTVLAILSWIAAISLAMIGGWQPVRFWKGSWRVILITSLLILGAFIIRIVNIRTIPIVLSGDEASSGLNAVSFIQGTTNNIFGVGWFSFPALHAFVQSLPISLLGQTTFALRLSSVVVGSLTVAAVYLVIRSMFNERAALFSAIFFSGLHYHIHFSRIGLNNVWDGLWYVVVLGLLWYGWEKEDRVSFLFAGLALGISQYFYLGVRSLFVIIPAWILLVGILDRDKFSRNIKNLFFMGLVTLVVFLPLANFFLQNPSEFMAPFRRVSIFGPWMDMEVENTGKAPWQILLNQLRLGFSGYTHIPIIFWYKPGVPILRFFPAIFFYLGVASLLPKLRQSRTLLMGLWLLMIGVMGGFSESAPAAQRYLAVAPALAIVVGLGLDALVGQFGKVWKSHVKWITALAVILVVLMSADDLRFYFYDYTPRSDFGDDNSMVAQRLADYLQDKPGDYIVLFMGSPRMGYSSISSILYLAPHIQGFDLNHPWGSDENEFPNSDHLIFVLLPDHILELEKIQADYPGGKLIVETIRGDEPLYYLYEVTPGTTLD